MGMKLDKSPHKIKYHIFFQFDNLYEYLDQTSYEEILGNNLVFH